MEVILKTTTKKCSALVAMYDAFFEFLKKHPEALKIDADPDNEFEDLLRESVQMRNDLVNAVNK